MQMKTSLRTYAYVDSQYIISTNWLARIFVFRIFTLKKSENLVVVFMREFPMNKFSSNLKAAIYFLHLSGMNLFIQTF